MVDKGVIQTIAVVVTIVLAAWSIGGDVKANTAAIAANTTALLHCAKMFVSCGVWLFRILLDITTTTLLVLLMPLMRIG